MSNASKKKSFKTRGRKLRIKPRSKSRRTTNAGVASTNRTFGGSAPTIQRGYLPFGRMFFARLPYADSFDITASALTNLTTIGETFATNNLFDPRTSLGGHQPMQYDLLAQTYGRTLVRACKVSLEFSNPTADGAYVGYRVKIPGDSLATSGRALDYLLEMRDTVFRPLNNTGKQVQRFTFYVDNAKVLGLTKAQYSDENYSHPMTAGPAADYVPVIHPFVLANGANDVQVSATIKITYYAQFYEPIASAQS